MFAFTAARRPLGVAASLFSLLVIVAAAAPAAAAEQGYLGIMLQDLTPSISKALQMGDRPGVIVNDVVDGSPAEKAGLQDGDVILELNGQAATSQAALTEAVRGLAPGDKANLVVLRDGRQTKLAAVAGKREARAEWPAAPDAEQMKEFEKLQKLEGLEGLKNLKDLEGMQWFEDGDTKVMVLPRGDGKAPRAFFHGKATATTGHHPHDGRRPRVARPAHGRAERPAGRVLRREGRRRRAGDRGRRGQSGREGRPARRRCHRQGRRHRSGHARCAARGDGRHQGGRRTVAAGAAQGQPPDRHGNAGHDAGDAMEGRRIEIIRDGEGDDARSVAPRMLRRLGRDGAPGEEREIIIERRDLADDDLDSVREEMEALRRELKELRKELKR
jgi:hypothetical protein